MVALRPELAKDFLRDVFKQFGGTNEQALDPIFNVINSLPKDPKIGENRAEAAYNDFYKFVESDLAEIGREDYRPESDNF